MLVGRVIETEAAYLDSGTGAAGELFGGDALTLGRDLHIAAADAIGAAPYLYSASDAGFLDAIADFVSDATDAVVDVATSIGDRTIDAVKVVADVVQIIAGPVLSTAQTWLDKVRSWGGAAAAWVLRTGEIIGRGIAEYGGDVAAFLRSVPVLAEIYEGIRAAQRITFQVFTFVPRLAAVVVRGDNIVDYIEREYRDFGANVGAVAEFAALVSSFVPGLGQLTGPALALCAGLLEGKDLSSALVGAVAAALPGGPLVQAGVEFGARVGTALAQGQRIDRAALGALKEAIPPSGRAAFVAAIELAQGGSLEEALQKAIAEGLPIDDLLSKVGIETSKLADFANVLRFKDFPDGIRNMAQALRDAGGTVLAQVDLKVPRFPGVAEVEALVLKVGGNVNDPRAMGEAAVAIAAFGGARVETFNLNVCPLTIEPRLDALTAALTAGGGSLVAIGDRVFAGSEFLKQAAEVRAAVYAAASNAIRSSADVKAAVADAFNNAAASFLERTLPGGAMRIDLGGGVFVVVGRTQGAPRIIDRVRSNQRLLEGGLARAIATGRIKISLRAEAAQTLSRPGLRAPLNLARALEGPTTDRAVRAYREALDVPTPPLPLKLAAAAVLPKTITPIRTIALLSQPKQAKGLEMKSYWYNPMREAQGIDPSNRAVYIVEPGDGPIKIAQKVVGDGRRWRELVAANPSKATKKTGPDAGNFVSLRVGERLNIPKAWETAVEKGVTPSGTVVVPVVVPSNPQIINAPPGNDTTPVVVPTPGPNPVRVVPTDPAVAPPPEVVRVTPTPAVDLTPGGGGMGGMGGMGGGALIAGAVVLGGLLFLGGKRKK